MTSWTSCSRLRSCPTSCTCYVASWMAGAALVLSVSAWYILHDRHVDLAKACFRLALPFFAVLAVLQLVIFGANQAIEVTNNQAVKLAAMEGLWNDTSCAPFYLIGWVERIRANDQRPQHSLPSELPLLRRLRRDGQGPELVLIPPRANDWVAGDPPINLAFQAYHLMIDLGVACSASSALSPPGSTTGRAKIFQWRWILRVLVVIRSPSSIVAIISWLVDG